MHMSKMRQTEDQLLLIYIFEISLKPGLGFYLKECLDIPPSLLSKTARNLASETNSVQLIIYQ